MPLSLRIKEHSPKTTDSGSLNTPRKEGRRYVPMKQSDPMPFGKHKGTPLEQIDKRYLRALYNHGIQSAELRSAIWRRLYEKKLTPEEKDLMLTEAIEAMADGSIPF